MSILAVNQEDLKCRSMKGRYKHKLLEWFESVEARAWKWVNSLSDKPNNLFLVTSQTLASEFANRHIESKSDTCSISLKFQTNVPTLADVTFLLGRDFKEISFSEGFQVVRRSMDNGHPRLFSIFLEVTESRRMEFLQVSSRSKIRSTIA